MSLKLNRVEDTPSISFDPLVDGKSYIAELVSIIDLGTHTDDYKGNLQDKNFLFFVFELLGKSVKDENGEDIPRYIGKQYNNIFTERSSLGKDLNSWFGSEAVKALSELKELLGEKALISVAQEYRDDGTPKMPKIQSIMNPPDYAVDTNGRLSELYQFDIEMLKGKNVQEAEAIVESIKPGFQFLKDKIYDSHEFQNMFVKPSAQSTQAQPAQAQPATGEMKDISELGK